MKILNCLIAVTLSVAVVKAQKALPDNFFMKRLDNGLEILVVEDPSVPLATLELCVKNGGYTESPQYDGLSHLYEHMFFKANRDYPNQEAFMDKMQELGAIFNGTTSEERVNYYMTVTNDRLDDALDFMNTAMRYPLFLQEEMKKENPVVDGEFQRAESNPVFFLLNDMNRHLWGDLYSRKNVIGDHDIIASATPTKMRIIKNKFYHPNNTLLAVAGDVDHKKVFSTVNKIYGDWESSNFDPFTKYPVPEFDPLPYSSRFITENENAQVPILLFSWHGPDTRNDITGTYAADVFAYILSQNSSKFHQELVESGLTQGIQASYQTLRHIGPIFIFSVIKDAQKLKDVIAKINEHIEMWDSEDYFTDEQLQVAKDRLAVQDAYTRERSSGYIHTLSYWWASADIDYYINYIDELQKVTREDIRNYVRKYIKGKKYVAGMLINPNQRKLFGTDKYFTTTITPDECTFTFIANSTSLTKEGAASLEGMAQWLAINPEQMINIQVYRAPTEKAKVKLNPEDIEYYHKKDQLPKKLPLEDARRVSIICKLAEKGIGPERIHEQVSFSSHK